MLPDGFFQRPAPELARDLIGVLLLVDEVGGAIVETEAYDATDPASHSFSGPTRRNGSMFGPPGRAYVYRSYGMHWCLNFVCGFGGEGSAVLIRSLQPLVGLQAMRARRGVEPERQLCAGPGRLCQALGITAVHDGMSLDGSPFRLEPRTDPVEIAIGPRIGISRGIATAWRFGLRGSSFLSRRFPD